MELDFENLGPAQYSAYEEIFDDLLEKTFSHLSIKDNYIVDVAIIDNEAIHKINKQYRDVDRPTDVISFAFFDDENESLLNSGDLPKPLGQILISYQKGEEQAKEYGHSLNREMSFLFVHGLLHLLGYDHIKQEDEEVMFKLQDEILGGRSNGQN